MNSPEDKLDQLFAAARRAKPETAREEFAFETRLTARIRAERGREIPWLAFSWKLTPLFACTVLMLGAWFAATSTTDPMDLASALSGGNEEAMLARYLTTTY